MDIIRHFQEAALLLQREPVYLELKTAGDENDRDAVLQDMIREYGSLRLALKDAVESGKDAVELDAKAMKLYGEIMAYPGIVRYHKAKAGADHLIALLGEIIMTALNGGDPLSVQPIQENCSQNCSACGGCHSAPAAHYTQ